MRRTLLWLLACLGLAWISSVTDAAPLKVMSAPNLLRVGTAENIFVECQDCGGEASMNVKISAWNHPTKSVELSHTTVQLNAANKYQALGELVIPPDSFDKHPTVKQYVYLLAAFPGHTLEKEVLVSFQSGYLFIQTDKPLYTPDDEVNFRIFGLTPGMRPIGREEATGNPVSITVEIVTPEGSFIPLDTVPLNSGMYSGTYRLDEFASVGQWKVVSRFQSSPQQSYSAEFEVKKYVLPSYEVKLTPDSSFYYYDTPSFNISVKSTYLFGKEVDGMAYVVFGVIKDNLRKVFPASLQNFPIIGGNGQATLQKDHILKTVPNMEELVGGSLFVTATVYTESGSEMVEGALRNMQIVNSPYIISFDETPKYFKAGMPFNVTVTVTNPDGTPAEGVPVVVEPGQNQDTTQANGRARLTVNTRATDSSLTITARTNDAQFPAERQTSKSMVAKPHQSSSQNYIHINVMTTDVKLGADLNVQIILNRQSSRFEMTYLVLSRGQLVHYGRQLSEDQVIVALNIQVTKKMLPSFRLVVYYHPTPTEVVSDSVWVDVDDSCMGTLKLEPKFSVPSYEPRRTFNLRVTGDPGATVGLVAVDKGVYVLNNKHLLTQKKVWDIVEKADTGCTPGGGKDSMGVFFDAGLMFQTDTAAGTPYRQDVKCSPGTLGDAITTLASTYKDPVEYECCKDGMKNTPLSYTCEQRKLYITHGKACEDAFFHCCDQLQRSELKKDKLFQTDSNGEEDDSYLDSSDITSRTRFPESWQWVTFRIPACAGNPDCEVNTYDTSIPLRDSMTTWVFTGISLSENNGICVGKPLDVVVFKSFSIDLRLPYSAVVGEQTEVRAILHNYIGDPITVRIELTENPDVCSSALKRGKYTQQVNVGPSTTRTVPFVIIPMKQGPLEIEVKATVKDSWYSDGVLKRLRVVPKGVLIRVIMGLKLDPRGGIQEQTVNNTVSKTEMVPNTPSSSKVFLTGSGQVRPPVERVIGASSMGDLISQPSGDGEANMIHMTNPVIATTYLDKTNQWEAVGVEKRNEALTYIMTGVRNQMQYAKNDGSFAIWAHQKSSTWLTAYVVKVFSMADNLITVNTGVICNAVKFLILRTQLPDGSFKESGIVYHMEMTGDVRGRDSDASMTAFCLIALQESRSICAPLVNDLPGAIDRSVAYLEARLPGLTNPYAVAITSYALANANKLNKEILYNFVAPEMNHWRSSQGALISLETTAYALLALVKGELLEEARPVVRWITQRQKVGGAYGSTQATVMVYQAVSEYWAVAKEPDYNLDVELMIPGRVLPYYFRFTRDNSYTTRASKKFEINKSVHVKASGTGQAFLSLVTQYYAVPKETVSDCTRFNLSVEFSLDKVDEENGDIYNLRMHFFFKDDVEDSTMSIFEIALPTGFIPMDEDLNALTQGRAAVIAQWEYNKEVSEKGSIIIYLRKVAHNRVEEVTFRMRQIHKVGVLQPASVSLYEYNDAKKCVKYYHPQRKDGHLILWRSTGNEYVCAEEDCTMQKKGNISSQERLDKACESTPNSKIDYVYQAVLEDVKNGSTFDTYTMRIEKVIKQGSYDKNPQGQLRKFHSPSRCRASLNLLNRKGYLIMGTADDTIIDLVSQSFEYLFGKRTWIEFWPRGEECHMEEHRPTCLGMEAMIDKYESYGCRAK